MRAKDYLGASEEINLSRMNGGGGLTLLGQSSFPLFEEQVYYDMKLTRTLDGEFYFYIRGGDFGYDDWTLVTVATGSNPVTDAFFTESKYFVIDLDFGDRFANLVMRKGVRQ